MAETGEIKVETLPDLDDLLQCPVCYEIPPGQIFQCNEGHHVCGRCKARLGQCPVCRALFFGTRNYAMEELIANIRKLQAFKLGGKMTVASSVASESTTSADTSVTGAALDASTEEDANNEVSNPTNLPPPSACKGLFRCLCCKTQTSERLPAGRLLNHLRYFHAPDLIEGKSEGGEYVQAWQIATVFGRIVIALRVSDMGVFFLVIEINKDTIYSWVSMASAPTVALEFCYTITISGNDREAVFTDCVWSVRSCEGALKKRGRCLTVNGADVRALCASSALGGRLALRRAPADSGVLPTHPRAVLRVANRGDTRPSGPAPALGLEPFLQDLHNDVARLSRAFADLGRQAADLVRAEARLENDNRQLPAVQAPPAVAAPPPVAAPVRPVPPPARPVPPPARPVPPSARPVPPSARPVPPPARPVPPPNHDVANNEGARLSRNARRRLRRRLNGAAEPSVLQSSPSPHHAFTGYAVASPQPVVQAPPNTVPTPQPRPILRSCGYVPDAQPEAVAAIRQEQQQQQQQPRGAQAVSSAPVLPQPAQVAGSSNGTAATESATRNKKKRKNQRK